MIAKAMYKKHWNREMIGRSSCSSKTCSSKRPVYNRFRQKGQVGKRAAFILARRQRLSQILHHCLPHRSQPRSSVVLEITSKQSMHSTIFSPSPMETLVKREYTVIYPSTFRKYFIKHYTSSSCRATDFFQANAFFASSTPVTSAISDGAKTCFSFSAHQTAS